MVGEALKGGRLIARLMEKQGYRVHPPTGMPACHSFITAVEVGSRERMIAFCKAVQQASPVGSYIEPIPGGTSLSSFASAALIMAKICWKHYNKGGLHKKVREGRRDNSMRSQDGLRAACS